MRRRALVRRSALLLSGAGIGAGSGLAGAETGGTETAAANGGVAGSIQRAAADTAKGQSAAWPQYQHDAQNTGGGGAVTGPKGRPRLRWWVDLGVGFRGAPLVAGGRVYAHVHREDGNTIVALDPATGAVDWETATGGQRTATPAYADGTLYVGGRQDGRIFALDATSGEEQWTTTVGGGVFAALAVADDALVAATNGAVAALDRATGDERWLVSAAGTDGQGKAPAVADGTVYAVHDQGFESWTLRALSLTDGGEEWSVERDDEAAAAVVGDGRVYVGGDVGLWAFDAATGEEVWSVDDRGSTLAYTDGALYAFGGLARRDPATGDRQWLAGRDTSASDVGAVADGVLYGRSGVPDGIVAVDPEDGEKRWQAPVWGRLESPAAVGDGALFVGDHTGRLYAFADGDGDPPTAAFSLSPDPPRMGDTVTLDASPTTAGDAAVDTYWWRIGVDVHKTGATIEHEFLEPGEKPVYLFVVDENDYTAASRRRVEVGVDGTATAVSESTTETPDRNGTATGPDPTRAIATADAMDRRTQAASATPMPPDTTAGGGAGDNSGSDGPLSAIPGGTATVAGAGVAAAAALAAGVARGGDDSADDSESAGGDGSTASGGDRPSGSGGGTASGEGTVGDSPPTERDQRETVTVPGGVSGEEGQARDSPSAERARRAEAGGRETTDPIDALGSGPSLASFDRGDPVRTVGRVETTPARGPNGAAAVVTAFAPDEAATVGRDAVDAFAEGLALWNRVDDHDAVATVGATGADPLPWVAHERRGRPVGAVDDVPDPVGIVADVCEAVHHLHRYGVAHGTVTPGSVWVDSDGVVLADVALAQFLPVPDAYRPPETDGGDDPTPDGDVYQVGVLAADLLGYRDGDGAGGEAVQSVLQRAVAAPGDRYETALHVRDALRETVDDGV